jgi:Xaa-Pro aminopeptidase
MRIERLKNELREREADGYLVTNVNNVYYFTGFMDISAATLNLIIPQNGGAVLLTQPLSYKAAVEKAANCAVKEVPFGEKMVDRLIWEVRSLGLKHLEFDSIPIAIFLKLVEGLGEVKFKPNQDLIWDLRRVKSNEEIEFLRKASELADIGVEAGIEAVKPGVREYEIAAEAEYAMRVHGSEGVAFETIVASGPRSAHPHGVCSRRVVHEGDFIIVDLGAIYSGYRSDLTRTVVVGRPSKRQSQIVNLVLEAQREALQRIRAGLKAKEADSVARDVLASGGYDKYFLHGLGHGVGLDIHEPPTLSSGSDDVLEEGNVVTVEPGIYIDGFGGGRIEDTVLVHKYGVERLTHASYYL